MNSSAPRQGLLYSDLRLGMSFRSPGRTITDTDVIGFAMLTGDMSEVHTSDVYAEASQFGRRIAHGMLGLAYAHGLMWPRTGLLRDTAIAFLGIQEWRFVKPIFIGDTIFVEYSVAEMRDSSSNPNNAVVTFDVRVVNQDGLVCQQGRKAELLSKGPLNGVAVSDSSSGDVVS